MIAVLYDCYMIIDNHVNIELYFPYMQTVGYNFVYKIGLDRGVRRVVVVNLTEIDCLKLEYWVIK